MPTGFSLFLDLVRFSAALAVFLHHFSMRSVFSGGFLWQFRGFGGPAVVVFFVLSGFVISHVTLRHHATGRRYAIDRAARILSVAIPAVVLTFVLDAVGERLAPALYASAERGPGGIAAQAAAALLFLNESWFGHINIGSNGPYWSLGYEVWYYAAFGIAVFGTGTWRVAGAVLALAIAGPRIALLFPLWLLGVAVHRLAPRIRLAPWAGLAIVVAISAGLPAYGVWMNMHGTPPFAGESGAPADVLPHYGIGLLFALDLVAAWAAAPLLLRLLGPVGPAIRWAAGMTLTLYLIHMPLLFLLRAVSPWPSASWANRILLLAGVAAAVLAIAPLTEYRRDAWRRVIDRLLPRPASA